MGIRFYKSSSAQQNNVTANTYNLVTFDKEIRSNSSDAVSHFDTLGFYDKGLSLSANKAQVLEAGDYSFVGQVRATETRTGLRSWVRTLLNRISTATGSNLLTYQGGGIARYKNPLLAKYANVGNPVNPVNPWYLTNKITITGGNDPLYNITGNIVAFDTSAGWIEYDGIVGTPTSPDTSTSVTGDMEVAVAVSPVKQGHSNVFSANNTDRHPLTANLQDLLVGDKIWLHHWHEESGLNSINLIWGNFDCFMEFKRDR